MSVTRSSGLTLALASALLAVGGCSALAARDPGPIPCEPDMVGENPCPSPLVCRAGTCVEMPTCTSPMPEICDGLDNDCNGLPDDGAMCPSDQLCVRGECRSGCGLAEVCNGVDDNCNGDIDEGLEMDEDGDSYSACDRLDPGRADCDDHNPDIHPGAVERCNGFDDDCNVATSDLSADCGIGNLCAVPTGETVPRCIDPRDCRLVPCRTGELCGADSACCMEGTAGCGAPTDCRSTGCGAGMYCAQNLSSSAWSCTPLGAVGATCLSDHDCASDRCYTRESLRLGGTGSVCGQACCADSDCTGGAICWAPGTGARSCVLPSDLTGVTHDYQLCTRPNACGSQACTTRTIDNGSGAMGRAFACGASPDLDCLLTGHCDAGICATGGYCLDPCGSAADCPFYQPACRYFGSANRWITSCAVTGASGTQGESCSGDSDCRDGLCLAGRCADTCCSDRSCASDPGALCSPVDHAGWEMRCVIHGMGPM